MTTDRGAHPPGDVGILFVHGIGDQQRAVTLERFAEPLVDWVDARARGLGGSGADVSEASMGEEGADPAHEWVEIELPDGTHVRWLLAEALWAKSFPTPPASAVLSWAGSFSSRVVARLISHLLRPVGAVLEMTGRGMGFARGTAEAMAGNGASAASGVGLFQLAIWLVVIFIMVISYVWVPLVAYALALLAVGVLAVAATWLVATALSLGVKVPLVSGRVNKLATKLVLSVGDSYALMRERGPAASMRTSVKDSLDWLSSRSRRVVIVAHSQGAALSVAVLARHQAPRVDSLVTVGGAIGLLRDVEPHPVTALRAARPDLRWMNIWAGWDPISAGPVVDQGERASERWAEIFGRDPAAPGPVKVPVDMLPPGEEAPNPAGGIGGELVGAVGAGIGEAYRQMALVTLKAIPRPAEPPPIPDKVAGPAEVAVHNRASLLRDHTSYTDNVEQVIARIAEIAADVGGHGEAWRGNDGEERQAAAERRHVTAVRLLGAARILNAIAAAIVAGALVEGGLSASLFAVVEDGVRTVNAKAGRWIDHLPGGDVGDAISYVALAVVVFAVWHGLTAAVWSAWRRTEQRRAASGASAQRGWLVLFGLLLTVSLAASVGLAQWSIERQSIQTSDDQNGVLLFAGLLLALLAWSWGGLRPRPVAERRSPVD